jgi:hypothetical protein
MKITIEQSVDDATVQRFYQVYRAAFEPMRTRAAARHCLTADEFAAEMRDPRIEKYVAWTDTGEAVGLTTMTRDLSTVAWIEPMFHTARHREAAERGALFYLGYLLVAPEGETFGVFKAMAETVMQVVAEARGVMGFDAAAHNTKRAIGRMIARMPTEYGAKVAVVDTQTYYTADFG